jgi:prevent-host-death family protein
MRKQRKSVNIYEAKTKLSELVTRASAGEEIVLARNGQPMAKLAPLTIEEFACEEVAIARGYGIDRGLIWIADDFDAPLPDLEAFFS